jgi:hypothetical protein
MGNGNWNGKRGQFTIMVVAFHDDEHKKAWYVHPKLPGLKSERVKTAEVGKLVGDALFEGWIMEVQ